MPNGRKVPGPGCAASALGPLGCGEGHGATRRAAAAAQRAGCEPGERGGGRGRQEEGEEEGNGAAARRIVVGSRLAKCQRDKNGTLGRQAQRLRKC